jgi:acyl carrier protein
MFDRHPKNQKSKYTVYSAKEIGDQIRRFIIDHFPAARRSRINDNDYLLEAGIIDSVGVLELVAFLEAAFNIAFSDEEFLPENFETISHLSDFVKKKLTTHSLA